jgi:DinB superfamily
VSTRIDLLAFQMEEAYSVMRQRLDGLTDDEFMWAPVSDPWTVFRDEDAGWTYHYEEPDPEPAPFTTIGWRLVHVALCKVIYHEWAYGPRLLNFINVDNPHDVESSITMLERGQDLLVEDLSSLSDDDLDTEVLTNWGEAWPAWRIFWTMIDHDSHHGGEIGALRDLYRIGGERSRLIRG